MGQVSASDTSPLKWYAFAYSSDGTDANMTTFGTNNNCLIDEINTTTVKPGTYYFISEYVLDTSQFNTNSDGDSPEEVEYNGSLLQKAMEDLKTNNTYKLYDSELFNLITNRDLPSETYTTDFADAGTTSSTFDQKFWPLSYNGTDEGEFGLLKKHGTSAVDSNCKTCTIGGTTASYWWLRSPAQCNGSRGYSYAHGVNSYGWQTSYSVSNTYGLRPAFKLEII